MNTYKGSKINRLLATHPQGVVLLSSWLNSQGYSLDLQKRYKASEWLASVGTGALKRFGDHVGYEGAIYALQKQAALNIHPGGGTALALLGKAHYLELSPKRVTLFGARGERLPLWFRTHDWGVEADYHTSAFLPPAVGLVDIPVKTFTIRISSAARAMLECLWLASEKQDLVACYELMEGLNNLRPGLVQQLLEQCRSIKVKRLFLYMAEKAGHEWLGHADLENVDLGSGKRSIVRNGAYVAKYGITVPRELEQHGKSAL